jgi:hypothetical protein
MLKEERLKELVERKEFYMLDINGGMEDGNFGLTVDTCGLVIDDMLGIKLQILEIIRDGKLRSLLAAYKEIEGKIGAIDWDMEKVDNLVEISNIALDVWVSKEMAEYAILSMEKVKEYVMG